MEDFELELKMDFLNESVDLLDSAENAFLRLESERENQDLLNEIFRLAHNLKGTSQAVGFDQLSELTHSAENLILKLKEGSLEVSDSIVSALLEFKDKVFEMIEGLKENLEAQFEISELKAKIERAVSGGTQASPADTSLSPREGESIEVPTAQEESWQDLKPPTQELVEANAPQISDVALESLRESGFDEQMIQEMMGSATEESQAVEQQEPSTPLPPPEAGAAPMPSRPERKSPSAASESDESIRVKLSRIDMINNVIGELVILQTVISQRRYEFIGDDLTNKSIGMMNKLFKEVQELAMSLRMLPLKATFQKMTRIVRDTSKLLGKDVNLHLVGEDTEVDKTVLEKIADPLVHIVRNAVDHGLELPHEREAQGKESKGQVELLAYHEGSNLVIQVTDDGKGIDPDVIRKKAQEKGLVGAGKELSDQEALQMIFHPGFSTKEQVSEVSGRGVGMDVVKTNIENLGGEVKLMSKKGEGSSLKIILPLTLAIIEGIVIEAQGEKFVLPLSQIYEIAQVKKTEMESFSGIAQLFKLRGEVLPLFHINAKIGKKVDDQQDSYTVIIVKGLQAVFGVAVDDILNQQQIVIKKLGEDIRNQKGVIGSAIMANGMPSLILDLYELFKSDFKKSRGYQKLKNQNNQVA